MPSCKIFSKFFLVQYMKCLQIVKKKKEFGEYFTRRHYTYILCKLLLENEEIFDNDKKFKILDPACGTGGFLTEGFKILQNRFFK